MSKEVLTTGEVAKYCGVNFRTVIRWIKQGHLNSYQLPGRGDNRIPVNDFLSFLRDNRIPVPVEYRECSKTVIIVDDELSTAKAIKRILRKNGFETVIAVNGFKAGILLNNFQPAVMTLDLKMPGLNGLEVIRIVKNDDRLKDMKILVVSAMPREMLDEARVAGADDVLEKPFENDVLAEKVLQLAGI